MTARAFDLHRLSRDIAIARELQGLTWTALAQHVGVAATTITRYSDADDAEADGVLTLIRWLGGAPETYIQGSAAEPEELPSPDSMRVRVDMAQLAAAQGDPRGARGRTRTTIQRLADTAQQSGRSIASFTRLSDT